MPDFGSKSTERLLTLHPDNQRVLRRAIIITDFSITYGYRDEDAQMEAYLGGFSNKQWGESTHNVMPSDGFDLAPYPIRWDDVDRFCYLAGVVMAVGHEMGVRLRWGGWWDKPKDYGHFERLRS